MSSIVKNLMLFQCFWRPFCDSGPNFFHLTLVFIRFPDNVFRLLEMFIFYWFSFEFVLIYVVFLQIFYWFSIDFRWSFNRFSLMCTVFSLALQWMFVGRSLGCRWICFVFSFDLLWIFDGFSFSARWIFVGSSMHLRWMFFGIAIGFSLDLCSIFFRYPMDS